jgi:hypothetical protein
MDFKTELSEMKSGLAAFMAEVKQRFSEVPAEPVEAAFGELTLVDGTIVVFDGEELNAGSMLSVKTEEGIVPAPDGVHETTDGLLVTTKDGVVELIEEKAMPVEEVEVENQFASLEQFDALRAANEELAAKIATLENALINVLGKVEETFSVFEKFASATPEPAKKPFGSVNKKNEEIFKGFVSALNKIKN